MSHRLWWLFVLAVTAMMLRWLVSCVGPEEPQSAVLVVDVRWGGALVVRMLLVAGMCLGGGLVMLHEGRVWLRTRRMTRR